VNGNHGLYGDLARQQEREQEIAPLVTVMVLIWKQKIAFQVSYRFFFNIYFDFFMFTFFFLILGIPWIRKGSGSYERYNRVIHHISFNPIQDGPFGGSPGMGGEHSNSWKDAYFCIKFGTYSSPCKEHKLVIKIFMKKKNVKTRVFFEHWLLSN